MNDRLDLLDYRRRVFEMYAKVRAGRSDPETTCLEFRRARDELFRAHPQSALSVEERAAFTGLSYFPYDPSLRFTLPVDTGVEPGAIEVHLREDGIMRLHRLGRLHFSCGNRSVSLSVFWIMGYGGGVFLPFKDLTSAETTYQGGRYVLDTMKGADLGEEETRLVVDFNYAYNPSCAYQGRWNCPLAPEENHLPVAIPAGERRFPALVTARDRAAPGSPARS